MESESNNKINEGIPDGATPLAPEELEGLLPKYITTRQELYDAEFKNISEVIKKYYLVIKKFEFTVLNLYKVHKEMFGHVWAWAGKKRITNKNIGVDKALIDIKLKELIDDMNYWIDHGMDEIEISARLHHRLVYIHPFNNGNGRWARFIVNIFLRDAANASLSFPEDELTLKTTIRKAYIKALEKADQLDYKPLIALHKTFLTVDINAIKR